MDKNFPWGALAGVRGLSKKIRSPPGCSYSKAESPYDVTWALLAWRAGQREVSLLKYKPWQQALLLSRAALPMGSTIVCDTWVAVGV